MSKVMVVEDDPTLLSLLKTLLLIEGFEVNIPDQPFQPEISALLSREKPDILLMDVHLHQANGIDILREIRQHPEYAPIKVLMTSGVDMKERCLAQGANAFLLKPYMPDDLVKTIRKNL